MYRCRVGSSERRRKETRSASWRYGRSRPPPIWSVGKVVPRGEIFINPSDPKHVMELLGCSDGLGMVILTRILRWDAFDGL